MNRSWNAKFICSALVATLVLATWASVQAAPLINLSLEGRKKGGDPAWLKTIPTVSVGDVIQYRLSVQMAPVGTSNTQRDPATGQPVATAITSLGTGDGMNSLFVALRQLASDGIQVDFTRGPVVTDPDTGDMIDTQNSLLPAAWRAGTGAFGGNLQTRAGSAFHDLGAVRAVRSSGNFAGATAPAFVLVPPSGDTFSLGEFRVMTDGALGTIMPMWGGSTSGGGKINSAQGGREVFVTDDTQANSQDPIVGFSPLVIGIPEPSTFVLAGMGVIGLVVFARRRNG